MYAAAPSLVDQPLSGYSNRRTTYNYKVMTKRIAVMGVYLERERQMKRFGFRDITEAFRRQKKRKFQLNPSTLALSSWVTWRKRATSTMQPLKPKHWSTSMPRTAAKRRRSNGKR